MRYSIIDVLKDALLFRLKFSKKEVVQHRRAICNDCEVRDSRADICTACGCFVPAKITLKKSSCPLELWMEDK